MTDSSVDLCTLKFSHFGSSSLTNTVQGISRGEKKKGKMISITQYNKAHNRLRIMIYRSTKYITRFWQQKHLSFIQTISKGRIKIAQKRRESVNAVSECLKELARLQRDSLELLWEESSR